jgi:teichuronic acid biosynthesis glycosyltransferase TuaC
MRILTFTTLFPSAKRLTFGIFVFQRVSHFAKLPGNLVQVVAPVPYFPSWIASKRWGIYGQIPSEETFGDLQVQHPRYPLLPGFLMPLHGLLMFLGSLSTVRRLHRQQHFDCIDAHYVYPDGFAAVLLGMALDLPVVISARGTDINVFSSFLAIRPMIRWALHHAVGIVAVAASLKNSMVGLGIPAERISVIPNGVDVDRFRPMEQVEARRELSLTQGRKIAVSVGSLTEGKNHKLLTSAFAKIVKIDPEAQLHILGEGPMRGELEQLIHVSSLKKNVFLAGAKPNEELRVWFSAADVSCLVSSREGWPNVLMESLACGTPVVATRVGGIPEIVVSPELGVLVEPNQDDIAVGLRLALSKQWDRTMLMQHARSRDWDQVANDFQIFLERMNIRARGAS